MKKITKRDLVSIIIPTHNAEKYLSEALESIFAQTYSNFEVIIIDNGSTDNTRNIVKNYEMPLKYHFQKNLGAGAARNVGFERSKGEFVAFLDHDDYWLPTKLEKQISILKSSSEIESVIGLVKNVQQKNWYLLDKKLARSAENAISALIPSVILIRRESFLRVGKFETDSTIGEVVDWSVRAKEKGLKTHSIKEVLVYRRIHQANTSILHKKFQKDYLRSLKRSIDRRKVINQT